MTQFTVSDLAGRVGADIEGDPERRVLGVASLRTAGPDDLAFLVRDSLGSQATGTAAGVLLAPRGFASADTDRTILRVDHPRLAFAKLLPLFHPEPEVPAGVDPSVTIGRGVVLAEEVTLAPGVVIEADAEIAAGTRIGPGSLVGAGVRIGRDCRLGHAVSILRGTRIGDRVIVHPGVRIGTDGFGYAETPEGARKIPQVGGCVIGDDVEIGANCTIDRGALGDTRIGDRVKIDNLVHIAHNVQIGEDCIIVAQVGIAGSAQIGPGAQLGGQAGIVGHLVIGPGARIAAQSGVISDVPAGAAYGGSPARPHAAWIRATALKMKLPDLVRRVAALEKRTAPEKTAAAEDESAAPQERTSGTDRVDSV